MVVLTPRTSKSVYYFRFYRQSQDLATIPEEDLIGSKESEYSWLRGCDIPLYAYVKDLRYLQFHSISVSSD